MSVIHVLKIVPSSDVLLSGGTSEGLTLTYQRDEERRKRSVTVLRGPTDGPADVLASLAAWIRTQSEQAPKK